MQNIQVETAYGTVSGVREGACFVFKGIPYAKPPVGQYRFAAPEEPDVFDGIYPADRYPNRSAQTAFQSADGFYEKEFYSDPVYETPISEDSLYLNIWTPEPGTGTNLPVLFYIHGGGFTGGTGHEVEFRTDAYAKKGVLLVTINYRLGIFGYLAHPWLYQEDPESCGNYAVLDQIAALDWVRKNIAAFGGDPENITICGQSAGGMSVQALLASRLADGKYQKAIMQSASGYPNYIANIEPLDAAMKMGEEVLAEAGITSLSELKRCPMEQLLKAQDKLVGKYMEAGIGLPYAPVINGTVLTENVTAAIENGHLYNVPYLIGSTKDDISVTSEESKSRDSQLHRSNVAFSQMTEKIQGNPAYVYYFAQNLPGDEAGAFHSSELWYTFGTLMNSWRPMGEKDERLSEEMVACWCNFAKKGDPNGAGVRRWERCTKEKPFVRVFEVN